jgi:Holliday junction resolvasome RuvABC endonuclease subunit
VNTVISRIIGFDLSLRQTGFAVCNGLVKGKQPQISTSVFSEFKADRTSPLFEVKRLQHVLSTLKQLVAVANPLDKQDTLIVLEGISFGSKGATVDQIAGMHWLVRYWLYQSGYRFMVVEPTRLKKFVLGKGVGQKDLILKGVLKEFSLDLATSDEADAAALVFIGMAFCGNYHCHNEAQRSVIRDLKKANPHLVELCL